MVPDPVTVGQPDTRLSFGDPAFPLHVTQQHRSLDILVTFYKDTQERGPLEML